MNSLEDTLAKNMKQLRFKEGMTQKDLAEKSGICRARIVEMELGSTSARLKDIQNLSEIFGVNPLKLFHSFVGYDNL